MAPLVLGDALVVGAFVPTLRSSTWLSIELASREINAAGGLPVEGSARPLVVLACDDTLASVTGAMTHLARLGARAAVASAEDRSLESALSFPGTRGSALFLSPRGSTLTPSSPGGEFLWSLGGRGDGLEGVVQRLIRRATDALASRGRAATSLRVASLSSIAIEDQNLQANVTANIDVSGRDASALSREDRFRPFTLPEDPVLRADIIAELVDYQADIVLAFLGGSFPSPGFEPRTGVLRVIEEDAARNGTAPPFYIMGPRTPYDPEVLDLATNSSSFRARAAAVTSDPAVDDARLAALVGRFTTAFPEATYVNPSATPDWQVYDALYYLAYALAEAPRSDSAEYSAVDVQTGLARITDGAAEVVSVGPGASGLDRVLALLADGLPFNTFSTNGPAGFDPLQSRSGRARALCWSIDGVPVEVPAESLDISLAPAPGSPCAVELLDAGR